MTSDAVTLFVERARAVRPGFGIFDEQTANAVIRICETLDGLPLGIELAAARMAAMSAVEVCDRLDQRLRLLTGPELGPDRQATLRHAVAWSYDLLDDDERATLRAASAFAGGFDLPALCAVAEASDDIDVLRILDSLVRKSLVTAHHGSARTRYSLFETIRAFVDEQLAETATSASRRAIGTRRTSQARQLGGGSAGTAPSGGTRSTGCSASWRTSGRRTAGASTAARSRRRRTSPRTPP